MGAILTIFELIVSILYAIGNRKICRFSLLPVSPNTVQPTLCDVGTTNIV